MKSLLIIFVYPLGTNNLYFKMAYGRLNIVEPFQYNIRVTKQTGLFLCMSKVQQLNDFLLDCKIFNSHIQAPN